jgi:hypothetical protein
MHPNKIITLNSKHVEMIEKFNKYKTEIIPNLKNEIILYEIKKNNNLNNIILVNECNENIDRLNDKINTLKKNISDYYVKNSKYIFEYFKMKQNIDKNGSLITKKYNNIQTNTDKYLLNIDCNYININSFESSKYNCNYCNKGEFIPIEEDDNYVCNNCNIYSTLLVSNDKTYKEPPKEISYYAYQKINHFKEVVAQFQGKETKKIDDGTIEIIRNKIIKERIVLPHGLTYEKLKYILRTLKLSNLYENIQFIKNKLGIKPPLFSYQTEETLFNLFIEIQPYFHKHCPHERRNFLNYYFVLYKLCEYIGETKYLSEIPKLKDPIKVLEHDEIWKKICIDLDWKYIPTV